MSMDSPTPVPGSSSSDALIRGVSPAAEDAYRAVESMLKRWGVSRADRARIGVWIAEAAAGGEAAMAFKDAAVSILAPVFDAEKTAT